MKAPLETPESEIFEACDALLAEYAGSDRKFLDVMQLFKVWMRFPRAIPAERQDVFGGWSSSDFMKALDYVGEKFDEQCSGASARTDL